MDEARRRETPIAPAHKKLTHLLLVVIGWVGFVWLWLLVGTRPWDWQGLIWLIVGSILVLPVLTGAWVLHNRAIHRRKGERLSVARVDMSYVRDWHGCEVQADWDGLRRCAHVVVQVHDGCKRYQGDAPSQPSAPLARTTLPA
jgi:hypothetical protein